MVVSLQAFCTLFHWEVSKEYLCGRAENATHYGAKRSYKYQTIPHFFVQENHNASPGNHDTPHLTATATPGFVHLEQNWECVHAQPPSRKQKCSRCIIMALLATHCYEVLLHAAFNSINKKTTT